MKFTLEPYAGPSSRYDCPACNGRRTFSRYINTETNQYLADHAGRCNREDSCGYHYKPHQYFEREGNGWHVPYRPPVKKVSPEPAATCQPDYYIHSDYVNASFINYDQNNFVQYLLKRFGLDVADTLVGRYRIGTSAHWPGATVFWQLDTQGLVRTGKVMLYDTVTGKRVKKPFNHVTWVHVLLVGSKQLAVSSRHGLNANCALPAANFKLKQCLFGEHLLAENPGMPVAIVESEKTAIIASFYLPQMIWLATGSLGNLNADRCRVLKNRNVTLFPDLGAYDKWLQKARLISHKFKVSNFLETNAFGDERTEGLDMADHLLRFSNDNWV